MKLTFLGTGTSQGVPLIAHENPELDLADPRNWRNRSSVHVEMGGWHVQVDAPPEFRLQCLKLDIRQIDTFILTHGHADHLLGMDDLRRFCELLPGNRLPVYSTEEGMGRVREVFPYALGDKPARRGYVCFDMQQMPELLETPGGTIQSTRLPHPPIESLGLIFTERETGKKLAYYNDCKRVNAAQREMARGADVLVLDALRPRDHISHLTIDEAIEVAQAIGARRTYFIHMTNNVDHQTWSDKLPAGIELSWDGLQVEV